MNKVYSKDFFMRPNVALLFVFLSASCTGLPMEMDLDSKANPFWSVQSTSWTPAYGYPQIISHLDPHTLFAALERVSLSSEQDYQLRVSFSHSSDEAPPGTPLMERTHYLLPDVQQNERKRSNSGQSTPPPPKRTCNVSTDQ